MPLYMDIHTVDSEDFSVEDVVKAHMEDLSIQDQFGVKQLKYWVNEQAKTIFCLMEGPDKEACNQVHLESHGNTACNIIEVADNEYNLFMGVGTDVNDLAHTESGELDTGFRTLMEVNLVFYGTDGKPHLEHVHKLIGDHKGTIVREPDLRILASFVYAGDALSCAAAIAAYLKEENKPVTFSMAVVSGKPVDEEGDFFFEETKARARGLCALGLNQLMYLDHESELLAQKESHAGHFEADGFTSISSGEMDFALALSELIQANLNHSDFSSEDLTQLLGVSKSHAYRKIKSLTGLAPNKVIQNARLQVALGRISQGDSNISEVAYECGYNSPTYFTRVFKKQFGISPTEFARY